MGWGKALVKWTSSPEQAMEILIELNNRFALDGHAPPSYGGLLGCLGLFEGPKRDQPVFGQVCFRPPKSKYADMPQNIDILWQNASCALTASKKNMMREVIESSDMD